MKSYSLAALAALSLTTTPALARPVQTDGDTKRTTVSYADLNLLTDAGQAELMARIRHAAEAVCAPTPDQHDVKAVMAFERCMKQSVEMGVAAIPTPSQLAGSGKPAG